MGKFRDGLGGDDESAAVHMRMDTDATDGSVSGGSRGSSGMVPLCCPMWELSCNIRKHHN